MDYQIAKSIRGRSLADVIAANLVAGESYSGAFGKAIKQKSVARLTRIKEKFDPLNIAKFLTGGSNLAPALLGRMMGRSQRDIQYFAGTARPIGKSSTAEKIGALPAGEDGSTIGILTDMYEFMRKTHENEKQRYELLNNRREEEELEKEKRHKELIKTIRGISTGKVITKEPKDDGSLFGSLIAIVKGMIDSLKNFIMPIIDGIKSFLKSIAWIEGLKAVLTNLGKWLLGALSSPAIVAAIGALIMGSLTTLGILSAAKAAKYKSALGVINDIPKGITGREPDVKDYENAIKASLKNKTPEQADYLKNIFTNAPELSDKQKELSRQAIENLSKPKEDRLITLPDGRQMTESELREMQRKSFENFNKPKTIPPPEPAQTVEVTGKRISKLSEENQMLNLPRKPETPSINNLTNISQTQKNQSMIISKLDKLSVRNPEETFQRMIYYSTRVV